MNERDQAGASRDSGQSPYDDDGALSEQTPGLDPEPIRREAGPDWPAGTEGDIEVDAEGSGRTQDEPATRS